MGGSVAAAGTSPEAAELVFSAPPWETAQDSQRIYGPIAEYLSAALGKKVIYRHSSDWLSYQQQMQKDAYDIVFDGPHFNGWRIANQGHTPIVKVADDFVFTVVVRNDGKIGDLKQLAGRRVCAMPAPNLGMLTLLEKFDNPARQPVIVSLSGWDNLYKGLLSGKCDGAVVPSQNLAKHPESKDVTRVVHRATPLPNQACSAGPRVAPAEQAKLAEALLSPKADSTLAALKDEYAINRLVSANRDEYVAHATYLRGVWGYR